jgi:hypothetical protein
MPKLLVMDEITGKPEVILDWREQANALIDTNGLVGGPRERQRKERATGSYL